MALAFVWTMAGQMAFADDIIPPKVYTTTPGGINVSDGSFAYSVRDLSIGPLTLERYHITGAIKPNRPLVGKNMSHNFDIYVAGRYRLGEYFPIVHIGNTASGIYTHSSYTGPFPPLNLDAERSGVLNWWGSPSWSGGSYLYTDRDGNVYTFSSTISRQGVANSKRISQIAFSNGRVQTFTYNGSNQLKLVSDTSGYAIVFDYNATGDVSAACGFNLSQTYLTVSSTCSGAALKVSYAYDANAVLTSATDVTGQVTTYPGNNNIGVTCVKPPGYSVCKMSMSYVGDVVTDQTMADGSHWGISPGSPAINDPEGIPTTDGSGEGGIIDPDSKATSFTFTKTSPYTMTDANGHVTQYRFQGSVLFTYVGDYYHDGTMLIEATMPEGNKYLAEYNGAFRGITKETLVAKSGTGLTDLVKTYGYGNCTVAPGTYQNCAKPLWIKDPKGNQTDYAYESWGGTKSEMQPAPSTGAARPLKLYTYTQKYAYIKNSGGTLVPAASPVWVVTSETACQTVAGSSTPTCDTGATVIVTNYEYGANGTADNLLLRGKVVDAGTGKLNLRTCYSYDTYGNKISETEPKAGLGSCP
ncbi:hypothetical protein [Novosphingobium album (ex Liu et al. 2023)]|uniref:RHS repeat protein n=1 Tax=Novosphingobium album (ex Liu et al. 2023) TaxID=3031130 RepID=A0ABT5WKB8_9SPHN|nr:hypothetical protein [Novosphingobium album (ex Liu et al. 2023)]MDE8650494.1 hypothetical protein [Novosphingobium album (ex Liu et al. 2023)]